MTRQGLVLLLAVWLAVVTSAVSDSNGLSTCADLQLDLALCIDSSASVTYGNWRITTAFVVQLMQKFKIGEHSVRVSLVKFSDTPTSVVEFKDSTNVLEMMSKVAQVSYDGLGTHTHLALDRLRTHTYSRSMGARQNVHKAAVVVTDGGAAEPEKTRGSSQLLQQLGVLIHAVGVGAGAGWLELERISSKADTDFIHIVQSYGQLLGVIDQVAASICKHSHVTATYQPPTPVPEPCVDKEQRQCEALGSDVCTDFYEWAEINCRLFCRHCAPPSATGTCHDLHSNCKQQKPVGICDPDSAKYKEYARSVCPFTCGLCTARATSAPKVTVPSNPGPMKNVPCLDLLSTCQKYGKIICTTADYIPWATVNCPKYCEICKP